MVSRRTLRLPQGRVSILEKGSPQPGEPSLVLIHGLIGTAATFLPLLEALPSHRHVIAADLPGAGYSDRDADLNPTFACMSHCVSLILDELGLSRPILAGHSHGGAVALHMAAARPHCVGSLVLLAPAHPYFRQADLLIAFYLSPLGRFFAHTIPWYPKSAQMAGLRQMMGPQSMDIPDRLAPYRENLRTRGTVAHLLRLLRTWHSDMGELSELLSAPLRLPALVLWGDYDRAVPVSTAPDLMRRLPCAELHVLPGVGHLPAEECPEVCAQLIEEWRERWLCPRKPPVSVAG